MNQALYLYDPRQGQLKPPETTWGRISPGRCVAYAHRRADGLWYVADLRTGRETQVATRTDAAELLAGMVAADSALTVAGAQ